MPPKLKVKDYVGEVVKYEGEKWLAYCYMIKSGMRPKYGWKWIKIDKFRPSPPFHAGDHKYQLLLGSQFPTYWVSRPDKNNVFRWINVTNMKDVFKYNEIISNKKPSFKHNIDEFNKKFQSAIKELSKYKIHVIRLPFFGPDRIDAVLDGFFAKMRKKHFSESESWAYLYEGEEFFEAIQKTGKVILCSQILKSQQDLVLTTLKKYFKKVDYRKNFYIDLYL